MGAIVGAVLFWVLKELLAVVIFFVVALGVGGLVTWIANEQVGTVAGVFFGWLAAVGWTIFAIVQTIVQIVAIIQLGVG